MKRGIFCRTRPVSGSNSWIESTSSSKSSIRTASSACSAGKMSIVSPRTRNVPRENSISLRLYCICVSRTMMSRWLSRSLCRSVSTIE